MKYFKKKGTLVTTEDLIHIAMGYTIVLVDDVEEAFKTSLLDFSDALEDDEILI